MFANNVGGIDRVLRIIVGIALIAFALMGQVSWAYVGWIGVVPLLTGLLGTCPAYGLIGLNTCPMKKS